MKANKSVCSDVPTIHFVKLSPKIIAPYLSKLFDKCVEFSLFQTLKYALDVTINKFVRKMMLTTIFLLYSPISKLFESL